MATAVETKTFALIQDLGEKLDMTPRQVGELLGIHPRTLQRRQESGSLEEAELLKAQMLEETLNLAITAFGTPEGARSWLFSKIATLEFGRPIDLLKTIGGYEKVRILLGHIIFGIY